MKRTMYEEGNGKKMKNNLLLLHERAVYVI
jgi:hypothetical protein